MLPRSLCDRGLALEDAEDEYGAALRGRALDGVVGLVRHVRLLGPLLDHVLGVVSTSRLAGYKGYHYPETYPRTSPILTGRPPKMKTEQDIESGITQLIKQYGEWTYDIPLPRGIWTGGHRGLPHTRLKRVMQIMNDLSLKPLGLCRILDLGCLEGLFSFECALQGSNVTGLEHKNRCTFVAIKGHKVHLHTSPTANELDEDWPEDSLAYSYSRTEPSLVSRVIGKLFRHG